MNQTNPLLLFERDLRREDEYPVPREHQPLQREHGYSQMEVFSAPEQNEHPEESFFRTEEENRGGMFRARRSGSRRSNAPRAGRAAIPLVGLTVSSAFIVTFAAAASNDGFMPELGRWARDVAQAYSVSMVKPQFGLPLDQVFALWNTAESEDDIAGTISGNQTDSDPSNGVGRTEMNGRAPEGEPPPKPSEDPDIPEAEPAPDPTPAPGYVSGVKPDPGLSPYPKPAPVPTPEPAPDPAPAPDPIPDIEPEPEPPNELKPEPEPEPGTGEDGGEGSDGSSGSGSSSSGSSHSHSYSWTVTTAAGCETDGVETGVCSCGAQRNRPIAALRHDWTAWMTAGEAEHSRSCARCRQNEQAAHGWSAWQEQGDRHTRSCTDCSEEQQTSHSWSVQSSDDKGHDAVCSACQATQIGPHIWEEWVTTSEPACDVEGIKEHSCSVCKVKETATIDVLNHEYELTADCTTGAAAWKCRVCADEKTVEVDTKMHTDGGGVCSVCQVNRPALSVNATLNEANNISSLQYEVRNGDVGIDAMNFLGAQWFVERLEGSDWVDNGPYPGGANLTTPGAYHYRVQLSYQGWAYELISNTVDYPSAP